MRNELLLLASLILAYGGTLIWLRLFGKSGLYGWTVIATIAANIEVLLLIDAFGMEQTLGNVLFASTFLATDILSECYGKKAAQRRSIWAWPHPSSLSCFPRAGCFIRPAPTTGWPVPSKPFSPILPG